MGIIWGEGNKGKEKCTLAISGTEKETSVLVLLRDMAYTGCGRSRSKGLHASKSVSSPLILQKFDCVSEEICDMCAENGYKQVKPTLQNL